MRHVIFTFILAGFCMAQTAPVFPGGIANDQQLLAAANNSTTTVTATVISSSTTLTVNSSAGFIPNQGATFLDTGEIVIICSIPTPTTLNLGYNGLCPNTNGRGFDGTVATSHPINTQLQGYNVSWHHNGLKNEVEAIEASLGANLANVGTVRQVTAGCGLAATASPIVSTGTISQTTVTAAHNGAYAVLTGDCGKVLTSNVTAAWTIVQAGTTGFEAGKNWTINNVGSGAITLTATTSTFYGGLSSNISGSVLTIPAFTGAYIFSDGTNYQVYTGSGGSGGSVGVNILAFGAVGNGTTDSYAAIQAAVNFVAGFTNGGTVLCPTGTYSISHAIQWTADNVYLAGDGGCVIATRASFTGNGGIVVGQTSTSSTPTQLGGLSNLTVDVSATSTTTLRAVQLIQTWSMILNNVSLKNPNGLSIPIQTGLEIASGEVPGATSAIIFAENNEIYNLRVTGSFLYGAHLVTGCTGSCPNGQVNGTNFFGGSIFGDAPFRAGTFGLKLDDNAGDTSRTDGLRLEDWGTCLYVGEQFNGPFDVRLEGCIVNEDGQAGIQYSTVFNPVVQPVFTSPTAVTTYGYWTNRIGGATIQTFNLPTPTGATLGHEYCFDQYFSNTGILTIQAPASTFIKYQGVSGSSAGSITSGGSVADQMCLVPINFQVYTVKSVAGGTWTNH